MNDYYGYAMGTTKKTKSKLVLDIELGDVHDKTTQFSLGNKIFMVFNDVEHKRTVTGYDQKRKLYHILYEDEDVEDFYHNEVKD